MQFWLATIVAVKGATSGMVKRVNFSCVYNVHCFQEDEDDVVEAHCYVVDIGQTDREQICSRINNNWCRTFRPRRPLSTACVQNLLWVLYAIDKGLRGRYDLHQLLLILLHICSWSVRPMKKMMIIICFLYNWKRFFWSQNILLILETVYICAMCITQSRIHPLASRCRGH